MSATLSIHPIIIPTLCNTNYAYYDCNAHNTIHSNNFIDFRLSNDFNDTRKANYLATSTTYWFKRNIPSILWWFLTIKTMSLLYSTCIILKLISSNHSMFQQKWKAMIFALLKGQCNKKDLFDRNVVVIQRLSIACFFQR